MSFSPPKTTFTLIGLSFSSFSASSFTSFAIAFPVPLFAFGVAIVASLPFSINWSKVFFVSATCALVAFNSVLAFCKLLEKALTQVEDSNTLANLLAAVPKSKFKAASKDSFSMPKID